ncbi:MAG: YkgJ family cysteine cluster protein [Candidatus Micrarchaeia archaeon]
MDMCRGCKADCCYSFSIPLSIADAYLLVQNGRGKLVRFIKAGRKADSFRAGLSYYKMELARRPTGECALLEYDGLGRCTIEEYKPAVCRAYPMHRPHPNAPAALLSTRACGAGRRPSVEDIAELESCLKDYEREWALHRELVARWNKSLLSYIPWAPLFMHVWCALISLWVARAKRQ